MGRLIARTDARNSTAINPTRNQSQMIQRRARAISSASLLTILPVAAPYNSWIMGQNTVGVTAQIMRNMITGNHSHKRNRNGAFHQLMSAPRMPSTIAPDKGWKKSPGFIGKCGP
jgi:hypothetical protein